MFYDRALSYNEQIACADCHQQSFGFADSQAFSRGADGKPLSRHTMALINLESRNHYGWADSSKGTLADQMLRPLFNAGPVEMCWLDYEQAILSRLDNRNLYRHARETLFPDVQVLARSHVVESIVTFENTLVSRQSDFDEWLENDKRPDDAVILWFRLFASERLGCSRCHNGPDHGWPWLRQYRSPWPGHAVGSTCRSGTGPAAISCAHTQKYCRDSALHV
ncbi:MAG: hypothetical protein CNE99_01375 [OM182 bacterium MED-G24]|uniref:Di-haem cytochrome c peroxidase domain-containing protein n=1 Tax=OM182 bacterium MED-G24 TaxID=1986255 RepID=A0A2A5WZK4_9GAMM|nr:MAG: hypothetical protein CNE99_01375 [OM182 bacterium MED-G24]